MHIRGTYRKLCLGACLLLACGAAYAQGPGGGPGGGGPGGMPGGGGRPGGPGGPGGGYGGPPRRGGGGPPPSGAPGGNGNTPGPAGGGRITQSGRWWDDKGNAQSLGLNGAQQKRMDAVFTQNRDALQQRFDAFNRAQSRLDSLKRSGNATEGSLFTEIDRVAQARAELEQAYTHMQLQIRSELTPDQINRLEDHH